MKQDISIAISLSPQVSMEEDNLLIKSILQGEKEKFRELVNRNKDLIYSLIIRQVGNPSDAEELTQEVFTKAYFNLSSFEGRSKFSTWLYRIALNTTNSYFRSRVYKEKIKTRNLDLSKHDMPQEKENISEDLTLFQRALAELKPIFREVLVLCGLQGHSYEEVAVMLNIPVGTVRSRLNTARLNVKGELRKLNEEF